MMIDIKHLCRFETGLRFEPFFALQVLADPQSRIHPEWKSTALARLPQAFHKGSRLLGNSPFLWPVVADAVENRNTSGSFQEMLETFASIRPAVLQERLFTGLFHETRAVSALVRGRADLHQTIGLLSRTKREWLTFVGLYPPSEDSGLLPSLKILLRAPADFQKMVAELMSLFWEHEFRHTWTELKEKLAESADEKQRLFESCSLPEFAKLALLRVEVEENRGYLKAVRGGATVRFRDIASIRFLPSAFNDKRHWTCYPDGDRVHVYFPYFDPAISLKQ